MMTIFRILQPSLVLFALFTVSASAQDAGDAEKGQKVFKKCAACHMVGENAKDRVGPVLNGIVGRAVAGAEGYKYGPSIRALGETGAVWDETELSGYLEDPRGYLRAILDDKKAKSKMAFKLKKPDDRADVIAYLKTFSQ